MYRSWRNIPAYDMPNYLAHLRKQQLNTSEIKATTTAATERIMRKPRNLPDNQPNEWIKKDGRLIVSPDNYND